MPAIAAGERARESYVSYLPLWEVNSEGCSIFQLTHSTVVGKACCLRTGHSLMLSSPVRQPDMFIYSELSDDGDPSWATESTRASPHDGFAIQTRSAPGSFRSFNNLETSFRLHHTIHIRVLYGMSRKAFFCSECNCLSFSVHRQSIMQLLSQRLTWGDKAFIRSMH
jgi:hypothetical protein